MTENEKISNAIDEIFRHYDCLYERRDLEMLPHGMQLHIADVYYKRPFDEDDYDTYDMSRELDREIFKAVNINTFKKLIGADELEKNGFEIVDIQTKSAIEKDFCFDENGSSDDIDYGFSESIKEISFRNSAGESAKFTSYEELKKSLDNPDDSFFHKPVQRTPIKDFSSAGAEKLREMTENSDTYINFLKFQGRVFKHNASVSLEFFTQRPETKFIATQEQWEKTNRTIAQGSEAIRFVDSNGRNTDFYDFSQVEESKPPYQWIINKKNANEIKKQLGIPEKMPIISGVINSTVNPTHITSCMAALGIPPKNYREFSKSYVNAIQLVIAGRLEVGGSNFNIQPDLTALKMLKTESQKLALLTYVANTARVALMKIEKVAKNLSEEERIERNGLQPVENADTTRTAERSGRRTPDNSDGNAEEQSDRSQSRENGRGSGLGDDTESTERQEHKVVSGVQNENSERSEILVQIRPDMRTLQPKSDGLRTVDGGRAGRDLRNEMDGLHGGELSAFSGGNETVSQVSDGGTLGGQQGTGLQGLTGRPIRRDESTSDGFRRSTEMGTGENVLLGQHGDEGNSFSAGDGSIDEKLNTVFSAVETEKTSTEKADVFVFDEEMSDEEKLVHITSEIAEKEKKFTDLVNVPERRYDLISDTAREIQELQKIKSELKEKIQEKPITMEDIQTLRDIRPVRKSVQNMLEHEVAQTSKLEKYLQSEMGEKSPYEQRKNNNEWRKDESKSVQITKIQPKDLPKKINDVRQKDNIKKIERGTFLNADTNMEIIFGKKSLDEIIAKAIQDDKRNVPVEARIAALYQMQEVVERAVCFDSQVSEYDPITSKNKSPNTLFMHQMYGILNYKNESYLAKLSVEESYITDKENNFSGTSNRIYNLRGIKITPIEANRVFSPAVNSTNAAEDTSTSVSIISIPQLYEIVKTYDKNFFENSEAVGRGEREAELYLQAEYNDAVAETEGNNSHSEKSELLENVADSRNISKEKAEEILQKEVKKLVVKRPVSVSERRKILDDFAEKNGLGKIDIWCKHSNPITWRIAESENGERLFNEQLCIIAKGENLSKEKLLQSLDEFEKSDFLIQYKQKKAESISEPEKISDNQPEYPFVSVKAGWNYDEYISPELEQKNYTVPEFNDALKKLSERWDGEEYETKSAFVTLTIHISETESFEKRLNAEYQFKTLSERLEYETDWFDTETELRKAVKTAENNAIVPELTEKEKAFLSGDIEAFMAKAVLAWDEIEDLGYPLYEKGYSERFSPNTTAIYGNGMSEAKLYDMAKRMHSGEDIRKELSLSLLGNQSTFTTTKDNIFNVEYGEDFITAKYENAERQISYEDMGNAFLNLIENEHNDIVHDRTVEDLQYVLRDLSDESAENLLTAFDNTAKPDWENSRQEQQKIQSALYDILGNEAQAEKAFKSIAKWKYNYEPINEIDTVHDLKEAVLDNDSFNENAVKYAFGKIMEERKYDFSNPTFMYLGHLQNYMIDHQIDNIVAGISSETLQNHYGNAPLTEEYFSPDYTFSKDLPEEYNAYFQEYISMEKSAEKESVSENVKSEIPDKIKFEVFGGGTLYFRDEKMNDLAKIGTDGIKYYTELSENDKKKVADRAKELNTMAKEDVPKSENMTEPEAEQLELFHVEEERPYQVITYDSDNLSDDKEDFSTLKEAQKRAKEYLKDNYEGYAIYNKNTKTIEETSGYFPSEKVFSFDVLRKNGIINSEQEPEMIKEFMENHEEKPTEIIPENNVQQSDLNIQDYIDYFENLPPEDDEYSEPEKTTKRRTFGDFQPVQEDTEEDEEEESIEEIFRKAGINPDGSLMENYSAQTEIVQENNVQSDLNIQDYMDYFENLPMEDDEHFELKNNENEDLSYAEKLYNKITEMFPEIASGDELEQISVEHFGSNVYGFKNHESDFTFEVDHEHKTINILEYKQDDLTFSVYDENNVPDWELLLSLEKNFMQNLEEYSPNDEIEDDIDEPEITETEEIEINDNTPELRAVLNEFSEKYGLGELNVEPERYNWKLSEKFQDGTNFTLGEITAPEYGKPFTPDELKTALEKFEEEVTSRNQNVSEIYDRKSIVENHGGISAHPKVQKNLPEITYASKPSEKINNNISAIREMLRLEEAEKRGVNPYDSRSNQYNSRQASEYRLRQYCGWGGLSQVFDERFKQYEYQRQSLKQMLTPEEYSAAKASSLNSHYTPQIIIDVMYKAVQNMDLPRDSKILEPACGTGNFISRLPHSFGNAEVTGVELDSITARIAHQINRDNENVKIINSGFENSGLENESFDLAIGNVPFGDYNMNDPDYVQDWRIHDAFFRKALDKVAVGGVVAFVTSTGTMDKSNPKIREYLTTQAELIGAVRLPNNAFSDAGTGVSSDIIFLKKRENPLQKDEPKPDWCYTIPDKNGLKINSYFVQNPQMILGEMKKTTFQDRLTCVPFENANLEKQLNEAIKNLNAKITVAKREKKINEQRGKIEPWGKNFTFQLKDDKIYYRKGGQMDEIKCTKSEKEKIKKLCEIRDVTRKLIDLQKTSVPDSELIPVREELNKIYDEYRSEYGELSDKSAKKLFSNDSDFPILQSLENYNKETRKTEKADIFFRRTVNPAIEIKSVESIEEALQISLDRKGKPDIPYMAILLEQPPENVCNELLEKGHIFIDPEKVLPDKQFSGVVERSEYLSGNVRMKLTLAEEYAKTNPEYNQNVNALKTVIPEDIKAEEISVQMGCSWIEPADYTEFLEHLSGRANYNSRRCDVSYSAVTGEFSVLNAGSKQSLNLNETTTYGTADYNMYQLAEKILNQRRIVVQREKVSPKDPSKTVTRTDPQATKIALEKAKLIREEFQKWIFADEKRKEKYERKYNDIFNSIVGRNYDGSHLTFAGMTNNFTLRPHQKNCVARAIYGGNTLAAHVVGAGKSAVIFTSVMKKKELGLINKACVVVPKALTEQTANEWRRVYPDAKILTVTNDDLSNETKRNLFTAKVATGSYDAVILSQEQFEKIPMSKAYRAEFIQKEIDSLEDMLTEKKLQNNGKKDYSVKAIEKAKKQLQTKLEKLLNPKSASRAKDDLLEFEQLGFDYLVCDEAHAYKNGFVTTKMTNVAGVTTRPSGRAEDMQMKTDYFNEQLGQGHILFCTGTPVSNSMTELYVMTRYLRPDLLKQAGIERFDDWAATFGNVVTKNQQTADGTLKMKTSFASFANLPELMAMYKEFADVQSADKLNLPRPELKTGKPQIISVPATPEQKAYVRQLAERAKAIENGSVEPHEDNHLKITGEARLIGLGNKAIKALYEKRDEELPYDFIDDKNSKVDKCVEKVAEIYEKTNDTKGVQIIFSDIAVNSDNGNFSVYDYLKTELIAKGIPENEIIFAPKSDSKERENIFRDINNSKYRVVIASTGTLGTGANIQQNLCALHHIDVPWKPSDFEQREGRILCQGNKNKEVEIFNYVTEGTLDSYLYQTVTNKARFIAQLLDDKAPARVSEDCDEKVLTYGEIQAAAEGNPDFKRRIEVSNEIAELTMLKNNYVHETAVTKEKIERIPKQIETQKELLSHVRNDKKSSEKIREIALSGTAKNSDYVVMTREKVNAHLLKMAQEKLANPEKEIPSVNINNFEVSVYFDKFNDEVCFQVRGESTYSCIAGTAENQDNYQRISNLFEKGIPKKEQEIMKEISALEENLEQAKERVEKPFSHETELAEKIEEFQKLEEKLSGLSVQEDVVFDPKEEPIIETAEEKSAREKIYNVDDDDYQPTDNDDNSKNIRR
ncbi:MAG: methyltransferase domain-containing protein [Ruminococcus flavefaciens]|nr:methyltransferase domain-containing protein [Ruminococcus flavefaciens]